MQKTRRYQLWLQRCQPHGWEKSVFNPYFNLFVNNWDTPASLDNSFARFLTGMEDADF
jgi:hypothetical protein